MAQSVLKQALQLMQEDLNLTDTSGQKKKNKAKNASKETTKTSRKEVRKELHRLQKQGQRKSKREKKPDFKSSIEKYQEEQLASRKLAETASRPVVTNPSHIKNAQKVFELHLQHANRRNENSSEKEEGTVFTDRDFDKFEEEYDFFN